ncbi:inorganic phosphate transporter-like protein pho88 [Microthyrium microscopicum]|uniref:Inorganic phosphate transporter-like protein pho88 n=1 Tax=Microthyrium microscopicum TaxID=703497 RepID=A0A6A6U1G2_9PEZI|nr:inorganic phosphate transporter-like protein pho88 [Microthyrium microscopicum]
MNPAISNLVIILFLVQAAKKIDFENPLVMTSARGAYILSNLIILGAYAYINMKINAKKDLTVIKYVEPAPMGSAEEPKAVVTTIYDYDRGQLKQLIRSTLMGVGMMCVMHFYFKYTNPLVIQSIIPLKGLFEGNLVKIHLLNKPASGELKRPWKANSGIMGAMQQGEIKTDKKSVEKAEKSTRGGAKEE